MALPQIPLYSGDTPDREQPQSVFSANADDWLNYQAPLPASYNALSSAINVLSEEIDDNAQLASSSAASASAIANYKGLWSSLSGSLNVPASVKHNGSFYFLLNNLVNVAASEPSVSSDWQLIVNVGNIRKSLLDSPLCHLFAPNSIDKVLKGSLTATRAGSATYVDRYGFIKTATTDEMREEKEGWLIEGSSTNLLTYSEEFDNAIWNKSRASITAVNITTAPDGNVTADELTDNTELNYHAVFQFENVTAGQYYTHSCFVKANTLNQAGLQFSGIEFGAAESLFDLVNGTVIQSINCLSSIRKLGNGWFRISSTALCKASGNSAMSILLGKNGTAFYLGDGNGSIRLWGAQVENLRFASSYIPTTTSPATRPKDLLFVDIDNNFVSGFEGDWSYSAEFKTLGVANQALFGSPNAIGNFEYCALVSESGVCALRDMSFDNAASSEFQHDLKQFLVGVRDSSVLAQYTDSVFSAKTNPVSTSGFDFSNKVYFGALNSSGVFQLYGYIKDFRLYDFALNHDEVLYLGGVE